MDICTVNISLRVNRLFFFYNYKTREINNYRHFVSYVFAILTCTSEEIFEIIPVATCESPVSFSVKAHRSPLHRQRTFNINWKIAGIQRSIYLGRADVIVSYSCLEDIHGRVVNWEGLFYELRRCTQFAQYL